MVYSFPTAIHKLRESTEYIVLKEKAEEIYDEGISELCVDTFYIQCQKYVCKRDMMNLVQSKFHLMI